MTHPSEKAREAVILAVLAAYHDGRLTADPVPSIMASAGVQRAFAALAVSPSTVDDSSGATADTNVSATPVTLDEAGAREAAHTAAFAAIYGPKADPFQNPEAFEYCGTVADAILSALAARSTQQPTQAEVEGECPDNSWTPYGKRSAYNLAQLLGIEGQEPTVVSIINRAYDEIVFLRALHPQGEASAPAQPASAAGEVEEAEPAAWAVAAEKAATEEYARYMGDPEGYDDTHTARRAAALVIEHHARAALFPQQPDKHHGLALTDEGTGEPQKTAGSDAQIVQPDTAPAVSAGRDLPFVIAEAKRMLRITQVTLECSADDERRWAETIEWLESLA